jgi:hypothetical protein
MFHCRSEGSEYNGGFCRSTFPGRSSIPGPSRTNHENLFARVDDDGGSAVSLRFLRC